MNKGKQCIRNLSKSEIEETMIEWSEPKFRAGQIYIWLWQKGIADFEEMSNIPKELRKRLEENFTIEKIKLDTLQKSEDRTIKCKFVLHDGFFIESVLIPTEKRMTVCVSSQVGCNLGCKFCATGFMKNQRNLEHYEIYDQVFMINQIAEENYQKHLSNIVYMGMGEPLLNYKNVLQSIEKITGEDGLAMSPKRITVSTAGISKMIRKLGDDQVKFNLALSLHAADDEKRSAIMPINDTNNLKDLTEALNYFYQKTKNDITFEYILFDGINESETDVKNLVKLCRKTNAKVNIIEYNSIKEADYTKSKSAQREKFIALLEEQGVVAKLRRSRGKDIDAACGQLANK